MKLIKGTRLIAAFGLVVGLVACGDDASKPGDATTDATTDTGTGDATSPDTGTDATTPDTTPDTGTDATTPDTSEDTTPTETVEDTTPTDTDTVTPTCTETGFSGEAFLDDQPDFGITTLGVVASDTSDLQIQFYDLGAGSPLTGPGEYPLSATAEDQNFATCTTCGLITLDGKFFFATEGTLDVTELDLDGGMVKATLTDATFIEVTIDFDGIGGADPTYESVPVAGGGVWCVPSVTIEVVPECGADADCTEAGKTFCDTSTFTCVGCLGPLDCTADNPVCGVDAGGELTCIAGIDLCTGDDANEQGDDGPMGANALTVGTPVDAKVCGEDGQDSGAEFDWYTFTLDAETNLEITLTWAGEADVDFYFVDAELNTVQSGGATEVNPEVLRAVKVPAGTYYIAVNSYAGAPTDAIDYNLSVATFTPECTVDAECVADPAKPACDLEGLVCVACLTSFHCTAAAPFCSFDDTGTPSCGTVDACTGDDALEHGDDGPNGAQVATLPATINGKICGALDAASADESDFVKVTLAADQSLTVKLEWTAVDADVDFYVYDSTGAAVDDGATSANPEEVTVSNPGAGDYFIEVRSYDGAPTDAIDYTLTLTVAAP